MTPADSSSRAHSAPEAGAVFPIRMPKTSDAAADSLILRWLKQEGDRVERGEALFELETDKAALEVESEHEGILLRIVAREGETVPAESIVGYLGDSRDALESWLAKNAPSETPPPAAPLPRGAARRPMSPMRRAIARKMTLSAQTIPHFYMKLTIEAGNLMAVYQRQKKTARVSLNDLLIAAVGRVMMQFPVFRSQMRGEDRIEFENANIGMVVAVEDGLRVPVVTEVEKRPLSDLAAETRRLIAEAREGRTANAGRGTLTISNLGMTEIEEFTAIVYPPEAAILAAGRVREGVKVEKGELRPAQLLTFWLSSNHLLVDGLAASRFLSALKKILEKPEILEES